MTEWLNWTEVKNISRNFLELLHGSVRSVHFQIIPCSSLYFFYKYRPLPVLSHCQLKGFILLHLSLPDWFPLLCFILVSSVCKSLQCLISALTQEGEGGHLLKLTCSVVLWGGRNTVNKYHWLVWGVLAVYGPHWVCPSSQWHWLSQSTLLRLQVAL